MEFLSPVTCVERLSGICSRLPPDARHVVGAQNQIRFSGRWADLGAHDGHSAAIAAQLIGRSGPARLGLAYCTSPLVIGLESGQVATRCGGARRRGRGC